MTDFDVVVIGGGPGGYVAAIRAAQLGMKVACVDQRKTWGGTCLNVGCIPSKALLESTEKWVYTKTKLKKHGISTTGCSFDLEQMMNRKNAIVEQLTRGISGLFKKNKVQPFCGRAQVLSGNEVEIQMDQEKKILKAKKIILAMGSQPTELPALAFDGKIVLSSTEALELSEVPKHLILVGAGVIALEMGSVWSRLGAQVTVVEYSDRVCSSLDPQIASLLTQSLTRQGYQWKINHESQQVKTSDSGCLLFLKNRVTQEVISLEADRILVAAGRKPCTKGLPELGIRLDAQGRVDVDATYQTSLPGVYAIGDLIRGPMLAHKAEEEGIAVVEMLAGQSAHVRYDIIPSVIYTWPEVASVGITETQAKDQGIDYTVGTFPWKANARAIVMEETEGMVKLIADRKTDRLLGAHIFGAYAGDLIAEAVSVMEFGGSAEDIARTSHAHPSLSEAMKEAAFSVAGRTLHL